ncbi:MAG TPA: LysR family transcriptional regulator [Candidatus Sulfotelmatobacter sp.]|nr:LysR family transcriptional regulator [Candidatus Sulfotelmatobacter sp.]
MEVDQLKTFVAVATFGGFRRAADVLFVSQPAVSARIKALEQSLGVTLFERSREGLVLSAAGRALRGRAEQLLQALAEAQQAVHEAAGMRGGVLRIAAALSICTYLLPNVLKQFRAENGKVMITVRSGHSKEVLEMVLRGEAEIGVARSLSHPLVETVSLGDDPLLLVAEPGHAPTTGRRAHLAEVADWPLIFFDRGSSDWTLTHGLFRRAGLVPNVVLEVETIEAAKRMVERGLGVAFLPRLAVMREIGRKDLLTIEVIDGDRLGRSLDVIQPRERPRSLEALAFFRTLQFTVRKLRTDGRPRT